MGAKGFIVKVDTCHEVNKNSEIFLIKFCWPNHPRIEPGQFITLEPASELSVMPRPFSVCASICEVNEETVAILMKVVGKNTALYAKMSQGDSIKIFGPKGKPIPIKESADKYCLVGGGIGAPGLMPFAKKLRSCNKLVDVYLGAYDFSQIVAVKDFENYGCEVKVITDTEGERTGFVTDLLEEELSQDKGKSVVVACGKIPMLKAVADMTVKSGNECLVLLEEMMACGTGSCKGCAVFMNDGTVKHVCKDGPVFDATKVDWKKLIPAKTQISLPQSRIIGQPMKTVLVGQQGKKLILDYPLMNASGCLDVEAIENEQYDATYIGMLVSKGTTLLPKVGNPAPRICETPCGMLNSIGLENPGVDVFIKEKLPQWLAFGKPLAVNISGSSPKEYAQLAGQLFNAGIKIVEVNVSCPNLLKRIIGKFPEDTFEVVRAIYQAAPNLFIIVKLPPMSSDIVAVAQAAYDAGADAISVINTVEGMDIDINTRRPKLGGIYGGLSGPAILPVGLKIANLLYNAKLGIPTIGVGGITDAEGAIKYFLSGANAVQFGTGGFANPNIATEIYLDVLKYMKKNNINHIQDLVGSLIVN